MQTKVFETTKHRLLVLTLALLGLLNMAMAPQDAQEKTQSATVSSDTTKPKRILETGSIQVAKPAAPSQPSGTQEMQSIGVPNEPQQDASLLKTIPCSECSLGSVQKPLAAPSITPSPGSVESVARPAAMPSDTSAKVIRSQEVTSTQTINKPQQAVQTDSSLRSQQKPPEAPQQKLIPGTSDGLSRPSPAPPPGETSSTSSPQAKEEPRPAESNREEPSLQNAFLADLVADRMYLRTGANSGTEVDIPVAGQPYFVHFNWRNISADAANNFRLEIKLNGTVLCFNNTQSANGNTSNIVWCTAALTWPSGSNTIQGVLDVNNVIAESNETNNSVSRLYPGATTPPDLVADRMYLRTGANSGTEVDIPVAGQQYFVHFDWRNTGSTAANNFRLEIKLNGTVLCFNNTQSANGNTSNIVWCTAALTWPSGSNTIQGVLDVNNVIAESNETNNMVRYFFSERSLFVG